MEKMKVAQIARELGCSAVAVYKKLKTIDPKFIVKENGVTYVTMAGVELLRKPASNRNEPEQVNNQVNGWLRQELDAKQKTIESMQATIDNLVRENSESQRRHDTIVMKMTNDIGHLQKLLEAPRAEVKAEGVSTPSKDVKPWQPPKRKDVLAGMSFWQRIYVQILHPEQLRCAEESLCGVGDSHG